MPGKFADIFTTRILDRLLPPGRADLFFEALYGDADEGAFDISLNFSGYDEKQQQLVFEFQLRERPGKCLACNLTHGLPEVFARHPLINIKGMVGEIEKLLSGRRCGDWSLGHTVTAARNLHLIPLRIALD